MDARAEVQRVYREHRGWVLARLLRTVRDIDLAEDALQQALEGALVQWPRAGVPDEPRAWLVSAAKNRAIDELRRRTMRGEKHEELAWLDDLTRPHAAPDDVPIRDDMLRLVFTCCHPALGEASQIALTLHAIAGLETDEIARAFLVPTPTMAQRLVRAKRKIEGARIPYEVPDARELPERLAGALGVVYLVFNEGYSATRGDELVRRDLCRVAIELGRSLAELFPDRAEPEGLLALMLLTDARGEARTDAGGEIVLLEDQDRRRWDRALVEEGLARTKRALGRSEIGSYALQAAIAAVHAEAPSAGETDWRQIVALYDELLRRAPTPVVELNRAVAVAMTEGPERGLAIMDALREPLDGFHLMHSGRGALLLRLGRLEEAAQAYARALSLCENAAQRRFLERRLRDARGEG